jgi:outer membrane protein assembly factor BamB
MIRRRSSLVLLTALVVGLAPQSSSGLTASATFTEHTNWPRFHFDIASTGYNPFENVLSPENVAGLVQKWAVPTAPGASPDPVTWEGLVYVAPADGVVRALDQVSGATVWTYDTLGTMSGAAPAVSQGVLYVGNENGTVFALDAATGGLVWSVTPTERVEDPIVVVDGTVLVNVQNDIPGGTRWETWALDQVTGSPIWHRGTGAVGSPAVGGGVLYISNPFFCGSLAFRLDNGALLWTRLNSGDGELCSTGPPALADGHIFSALNNDFLARQASRGSLTWDARSPHYIYSTPAVAQGVVYAASWDGFVVALREATGSLRWSTQLPAEAGGSSPAVANSVVYIGAADGVLRALDAETGAILWESPPAPSAIGASPAVSDGVLYASSDDGTVYAYGLP